MPADKRLRFWIICAPVPLLVGCNQSPIVTSADVAEVLTKAAIASVKVVPVNSCVKSGLNPSPIRWAGKEDLDGWIKPANSSEPAFRRVVSPDLNLLPQSVVATFSDKSRGKDCRHPITFDKPTFIETDSADGGYIEAVVSFSDECPVCGSGYMARFRRSGSEWEMQPPGIEVTWIS